MNPIWILSPTLPPIICGVGAHTTKLVRELAHLHPDWTFTIYTTAPDVTGQPVDPCFNESNIDVQAIVKSWGGHNIASQMRHLYQQAKQADVLPACLLVQYTPHLYHRLGINMAIVNALRLYADKGIPVFIMAHELFVPMDPHPRHWITGPIQRLMLKNLVQFAKGIFVNSKTRQADLFKRYPQFRQKIHYLPVTTNIDRVDWPESERTALRLQWVQKPEEKLLLFWGKLHSSKLLPLTLKTLQHLQQNQLAFQALYIGPDTELLKGQLEQHYPELLPQIHILGPLPETDVSRYLQTVDLMLYPLDDGASPRRGALMAAIQHGTPTVTTKGPATDDVMGQCPNMAFAAPLSQFPEQTRQCLLNPDFGSCEKRQAMQAYFQSYYTWEGIATTLWANIQSALVKQPVTPTGQ